MQHCVLRTEHYTIYVLPTCCVSIGKSGGEMATGQTGQTGGKNEMRRVYLHIPCLTLPCLAFALFCFALTVDLLTVRGVRVAQASFFGVGLTGNQ